MNELKHYLICFTAISWLMACSPPATDEDSALERQSEEILRGVSPDDLEILEIEGCEYFVFKDHSGGNKGFGFMAHKGNCKNPIHCYITSDTTSKNTD